MIKSLFFTQKKPITVIVLGGLMFVLSLWFLLTGSGPLNQIVVMGLLAMLLLGYTISFEISEDFNNKRHLMIFGMSILMSRLNIAFPDYITVFSAKYKQGAEWGSVAAIGKERTGDSWVIRLFKGNKHFTVYRTKSLQNAKNRATELSTLLGVRIRGKNT